MYIIFSAVHIREIQSWTRGLRAESQLGPVGQVLLSQDQELRGAFFLIAFFR